LGTAWYMSPEQARGRPVDKRADVWSFGCVLYETLTGRKAFGGESFSDALAAVLSSEPDWSRLPRSTPAAVRDLLERCLEKDPARRLRDAGDAALELDRALSASAMTAAADGRAAETGSSFLASLTSLFRSSRARTESSSPSAPSRLSQ